MKKNNNHQTRKIKQLKKESKPMLKPNKSIYKHIITTNTMFQTLSKFIHNQPQMQIPNKPDFLIQKKMKLKDNLNQIIIVK